MYDLIVIGAGPGGYPAAVFAAQNKLKVAVIEKENLGGVCLNWGCIPTKALLKASEQVFNIKHASNWGIEATCKVDIQKMVAQSRNVVEKLSNGIAFLFSSNKIEHIKGHGAIKSIESDHVVISCGTGLIKAKNVIIATGSSARVLPNLPKSNLIWDVKAAMTPKQLPNKLAIIGAGAIGVEFANFYSNLGVNVTIFEVAPNILVGTDVEVAKTMQKIMQKSGITFNLETKLEKVEEKNSKLMLTFNNQAQEFDNLIVAAGVIPNTQDFPQLELENNYFKTNELHQAFIQGKSVKNIFCIGDCAKGPWLAHKATAEGIRAIKTILGGKLEKFQAVPLCIYTSPQIAAIGKTQEQLMQEFGQDYTKRVKVLSSKFAANGKAVAIGEIEGFIKILCDATTGEILGAHMIGPDVTELVHSIALGMKLEALPEDFANTIFPHPTLSESILDTFMSLH